MKSCVRLKEKAKSVGKASLFVGCLTSQQHASIAQGRICSDKFTCCHTDIEVANQTFHFTQSQYTDTGSIIPSTDPITPGVWQGSHWSASFEVTCKTRPRKNLGASGGQSKTHHTARVIHYINTKVLRPTVHWQQNTLFKVVVNFQYGCCLSNIPTTYRIYLRDGPA